MAKQALAEFDVCDESIQPVLKSQAGHLAEIARVAGQESGVVREDAAGDLQIHRADAHVFASKAHEQVGGRSIPRQHGPRGEEINAALQPLVGKNLPMRIVRRWISASHPRSCSSTVTIVVARSCPDAAIGSSNPSPTSEGRLSAETWSVSRTNNFSFVSLLFAVLASEPFSFLR